MLEYKRFAEFKDVGDGAGGFEGYASVFGVLDDGGDIVDAGAFKDTLPQFLREGFIGLGHDWRLAIGTIADAHEDSHGLYLRGEYHSTASAQEARTVALERARRDKSTGLSIGFSIRPDGAAFTDDGVRHLKSLDLYEVSQVTVPMLRAAGITDVKSHERDLSFDDHSERVRVAVAELVERARSGSDLRLKEGRMISSARRVRLTEMRDALHSHANEIEALLLETAPPEKALYLEFQRTLAAIRS